MIKKTVINSIPYLILVLIASVMVFTVDGFMNIQMMKAIDAVTQMDRGLFQSQLSNLVLLALTLIPTSLALAFAKGLYKKKAMVSGKKFFIEGIFKKDINQFQSENTASYVSALTNDMANIEVNLIDGIYEVVVNFVNFTIGILVIAYVSPIALVAGVLLGIIGMGVSILMGIPLQKHQLKRSEFFKGYTAYIKEFLGAFHIIKANDLSEKVKVDFYNKSKDIQDRGYIIDRIISYVSASQNFLMMFIMYGLLAFSVYLTIKGELTLGGVILVANSMDKILNPLMQISEWVPKIMSTKGILKNVDSLLVCDEVESKFQSFDTFASQLVLNQVGFKYGETEVLNQTDLVFEFGKKYLVIGPSGGGKSTLLKLIRKYFQPIDGELLMDQRNIATIGYEDYYRQLANIEQQIFVFEDTLKNNLCLYKNFTDVEIMEAVEKAGLNDFVDKHPDKLERMILDNGKNISGGEKSRIAIARGLLQKARLLILDEALSTLDSHTAKAVEKTLLELRDVTVINVSHVIFEENKNDYDEIYMVKNKKVYALS